MISGPVGYARHGGHGACTGRVHGCQGRWVHIHVWARPRPVLVVAEYMGAKDDGCISMSGPGHDRCLQDPREPFPTRGHSRSRSDGSRRRLQPHRRPMAPKVPVVNWGRIRGLCRQGRQRLRGHARRVDRQRVASYAMLGGCNASLTIHSLPWPDFGRRVVVNATSGSTDGSEVRTRMDTIRCQRESGQFLSVWLYCKLFLTCTHIAY